MNGPYCELRAGGVDSVLESTWLAAYTRPRHENQVRVYCEQRGLEVYLPSYQSRRRWSDRNKLLSLPLFPSYVFLRLSVADRRRAVQAPGFLWFVHNHGAPVTVDETELEAIRQLLASGLEFDPLPGAEIGDEVEVVAGPLSGLRGRLIRKNRAAIALVVAAINGGVRVNIPDPAWIVPVGGARGWRLACRSDLPAFPDAAGRQPSFHAALPVGVPQRNLRMQTATSHCH